MFFQTHSVSLDAGKSRGSGESTSSLQEGHSRRCVLELFSGTLPGHAVCLWTLAGTGVTHLGASSSALTRTAGFSSITLMETRRHSVEPRETSLDGR